MRILIYDSGLGSLSVIREIFRQHKKNDYYLYLDEDVFPLGDKTSTFIEEHLLSLLAQWEEEHYDIIIMACNTMSLYARKIKTSLKIITILDYNLNHMPDGCLFLGTANCVNNLRYHPKKSGKDLAGAIESEDVERIIKIIKSFHFTHEHVLLGCTHYPLVKEIFRHYYPHITFCSYEDTLVGDLPDGEVMALEGNKRGQQVIEQFLRK